MSLTTNCLLRRILSRLEDCISGRPLGPQPRPCLVDEKPAVFHRFVDEDRVLLRFNKFCRPADQVAVFRHFQETGVYREDTCSTEIIRSTLALVEYMDGSVGKVDPALVTFLGNEKSGDGRV